MLAQKLGSGMCFCMCQESAFALVFIGKCGPPCIVAGIFSSVFRKALSREVVPFWDTLVCSIGCRFVEAWPRKGELLKLIITRSLLHDSGLVMFLMITTLYGQGPGFILSCKPAAFCLRRLRWKSWMMCTVLWGICLGSFYIHMGTNNSGEIRGWLVVYNVFFLSHLQIYFVLPLVFSGLFWKVRDWVFKMLIEGWLNIREKE